MSYRFTFRCGTVTVAVLAATERAAWRHIRYEAQNRELPAPELIRIEPLADEIISAPDDVPEPYDHAALVAETIRILVEDKRREADEQAFAE